MAATQTALIPAGWIRSLTALVLISGALLATSPLVSAKDSSCSLVYLPVTASFPSSYDDTPDWAPPQDPMAPFDGNFETRWATLAGVDNQSVYVDFGKPKQLSKIVIYWERAYATDYELQVSDDAQSWKPLVAQAAQDG